MFFFTGSCTIFSPASIIYSKESCLLYFQHWVIYIYKIRRYQNREIINVCTSDMKD